MDRVATPSPGLSPARMHGTPPTTPSRAEGDLVATAFRDENLRLKQELQAAQERNAELERARRAEAEAANPAPEETAAHLTPRGLRATFKVSEWDNERRDSEKVVVEGAPPVAKEPAGGEELAVVSVAEEVAAEIPRPRELGPLLPDWIVQTSLRGACPCRWRGEAAKATQALCHEVHTAMLSSDFEKASALLTQAYTLHCEQTSSAVYLGFSALFPPLSQALASTSSQPEAFKVIAQLLRPLLKRAPYGKTPPAIRPAEVPRLQYVREVVAHAGLCLDLARIAFVERKLSSTTKRRPQDEELLLSAPSPLASPQSAHSGDAAGGQPLLALPDGQEVATKAGSASSPLSRSRSPRRRTAPSPDAQLVKRDSGAGAREARCVDRRELQALLSQASSYLAAAQMDIERLYDEEVASHVPEPEDATAATQLDTQTQTHAQAAESTSSSSATAAALLQTAAVAAAAPRAATPETQVVAFESAGPPAATSSAEEVQAQIAAAAAARSTSSSASSPQGTGDDVARERTRPSFGQLLSHQLLPLYVADVPFEVLRRILDEECGCPIDSDEEEEAWKLIGSPNPRAQKKLTQRSSNAQTLSTKQPDSPAKTQQASKASTMPPPAGNFSELIRAATSRRDLKAPARQVFPDSVVEKLRTGHRAPRNMDPRQRDVAMGTRRLSSASLVPSTPQLSSALRVFSTPQHAPKRLSLVTSPLSVRGRDSCFYTGSEVTPSRSPTRPAASGDVAPVTPKRSPAWGLLDDSTCKRR